MNYDEREFDWRAIAEFTPKGDGFDMHRALGANVVTEVMDSEHDEPQIEAVH